MALSLNVLQPPPLAESRCSVCSSAHHFTASGCILLTGHSISQLEAKAIVFFLTLRSVRGDVGSDVQNIFYEKVTSLTGDQPPIVMVTPSFAHLTVQKRACSLWIPNLNQMIFVPPFLYQSHKGIYFIHIRQGGLYWVATTTTPDSSPFTVIEFLNRCVSVFTVSNTHFSTNTTTILILLWILTSCLLRVLTSPHMTPL